MAQPVRAFETLKKIKKQKKMEESTDLIDMIKSEIDKGTGDSSETSYSDPNDDTRKGEHLETKYYRLERLIKWEHIDELNDMLLNGISPKACSAWCKENGFSISHPKLYEYKDLLKQAIDNDIKIESLLGVGDPDKGKNILLGKINSDRFVGRVKNEMQLLDELIQRGMDELNNNPAIRIETAMKAIEVKNKLTGGRHAGLTDYGLDQLRAIETAKMDALVAVVMKYLPEDRYKEVIAAVANAEHEFYRTEAPELLEEYERSVAEEELELAEGKGEEE